MKISVANYIETGHTPVPILAVNMTKKDYVSKYRGHLFCKESECSALLSFVERKKSNSRYFRTWSKSKHKPGCHNEVFYDDEHFNNSYDSEKLQINLTDKHIAEKLKRAYEALLKSQSENPTEGSNQNNSKAKTNTNGVGSIPALFDDGESIPNSKQPYILTRNYDKLDSSDFGEVRCVVGYVKSIFLFDTHGYINLTKKGPDSVKVFFSKAFVYDEKNKVQYPNFNIIKDFILNSKKERTPLLCCCIGRIEPAQNGINVCPDRYNGFNINGLGYYDIIRLQHKLT